MAATTNEEYLARLYDNLSLRETDDLLEIYQHGTLDEWDEATFEVIKQILEERNEPIPAPPSDLQQVRLGREKWVEKTNNEFRAGAKQNLSELETADLVEIYQHGTLDDWDEEVFGTIGQILTNRAQPVPILSAHVQFARLSREAYSLLDAEDWPALLEKTTRMVEMLPENYEGYTLRGRALTELDKLDQALLNLQTSLHLNPDQSDVWEEWLGLMDEMSELDEVRTRECDFTESLACQHLDSALDLIQEDRIEEALVEIESARACLPEIALAHNYLGQIYEEMDNVEPAIEAYRQAIHCNPRFYPARQNLANATLRWEAEQYRHAALMEPSAEELPEYSPDDWQAAPDDTLPEWFYLDETAFWLRGWPGNRTRSGRTGLDPLDREFELAHLQGVVLRMLFTGRFRTRDPFHFVFLLVASLLFICPLVMCVTGESALMLIFLFAVTSFYPITGVLIAINLVRSLNTSPTESDKERGLIFY